MAFVFSGSRLSEMEPCGCQASQNGGIDREAVLYKNLRTQYPSLIKMEVGKWTDPFQTPNEKLKTEFLVRSLHDLDFDVYNVTPFDLAYGTTYPLRLVEGNKGRLVAANLLAVPSDAPEKGLVQLYDPYVILEVPTASSSPTVRVGVIGVTDPTVVLKAYTDRLRSVTRALPEFKLNDLMETLKQYIPIVREKSDIVVVLALMQRYNAQKAARELEGVDLFVNTMDNNGWRQVLPAGKAWSISTGQLGRHFSRAVVTLNGDGVPTTVTGALVDIPSEGKTDPSITRHIMDFREETKNLVRRQAIAREKSRFAGRTKCLGCHRDEYLQWTRTPHNLAFATLVRKGQQYNPDCLRCHTTGFDEEDGFVDVSQTPYLVAVQCEVCHGPAQEHAKKLNAMLAEHPEIRKGNISDDIEYPVLVANPEPALCKQCHDGDNDPHFDYANDVKYISHKNMSGPFRRPKDHGTATNPAMTHTP